MRDRISRLKQFFDLVFAALAYEFQISFESKHTDLISYQSVQTVLDSAAGKTIVPIHLCSGDSVLTVFDIQWTGIQR